MAGAEFDPAIELKFDAAVLPDHRAFGKKEIVKRLQSLPTLATHIQAEPDGARYSCYRMFPRIGSQYARRDDNVASTLQHRPPMPVQMGHQFRNRKDGVTAKPTRDRSRVACFAHASHRAMADVASDARHDPNRQLSSHEDRSLFDVKFDPSRHAAWIEQDVTFRDAR